jgi:glucose/arabinose dehydrogenase
MSKTFLLAGATAVAGISFCTAAKKPEPSPAKMAQGVSVTAFYNDTCAKCHGVNAEGGGGGTRTLLTEEKFDQKNDRTFFDAIKNGVHDMGMEAYGPSMTDEAIWAQVVHIRELQAKALRREKGAPQPVDGVYHSKRQNFRVETVVDSGLKLPWGIGWLPDGKMLVTNRSGTLNIFNGSARGVVEGLPRSVEQGQGGLMEVAAHPDYAKNGWLYLTIADPGQERGAMTKIVRGKLQFTGDNARWTDQQTIWEADQKFYTGAGIHFGSKIVFDGKGHIFFSVGERGGNMLAQEITNPFGKIYRLNEDGTEPADNPFVGQAGAIKGIWSYGHRNPQGLAIDASGQLWDTEHGPRGGDEVNKIEKGANYGWPVVCFGINYNDTPFRIPWPKADQHINMPVFRWLPSIGASGFKLVNGSAYPQWKGDMIAGGLSGKNVDRFRLVRGNLVEREELLFDLGRVRDIGVGPDGLVYVVLNEPDKIVKLVPAP